MKRKYCDNCLKVLSHCYCHKIQAIDNQWPVWVLQDPKEAKHALNTLKIAELSLSRCRVFLHGIDNIALEDLIVKEKPLLIFPSDKSLDFGVFVGEKESTLSPRPLLFIDATWRKAKRIFFETPSLQLLDQFHLADVGESKYLLRKSRKENSLSSIEAINYCLACLEKDFSTELLLDPLAYMLEQQVQAMGLETFRKNYE